MIRLFPSFRVQPVLSLNLKRVLMDSVERGLISDRLTTSTFC